MWIWTISNIWCNLWLKFLKTTHTIYHRFQESIQSEPFHQRQPPLMIKNQTEILNCCICSLVFSCDIRTSSFGNICWLSGRGPRSQKWFQTHSSCGFLPLYTALLHFMMIRRKRTWPGLTGCCPSPAFIQSPGTGCAANNLVYFCILTSKEQLSEVQ